jgi:hypothetical protein
MGGSVDGAYFESEEKRRTEMEVDRRRAVQQKSGAQYDEALGVSFAAPKRLLFCPPSLHPVTSMIGIDKNSKNYQVDRIRILQTRRRS